MIEVFLFILGLTFGSFVNVLIHRIPRGLGIAGRSFCPKCKKKISWYDNIPLLSFFLLGGKCRHCRKKISPQYPLVELAAGIGFLLIGPNLFWLAIFLVLLAIFVIDLRHQIIPDSLVFSGMAASLFVMQSTVYNSLFAGFLFASLFVLLHLITGGKGMGLGDVKFAVMGGILLGLRTGIFWLFLSFLTGAVVSIILILWGKKGLKDKIAFGPFLVVAIPLSLLLKSLLWLQLSLFLPFW